ncbi:MAG TPA: EamA/RhaT family transporter, partial [bacterium]|nr:EamA/RhaT family transporter [bacterium]
TLGMVFVMLAIGVTDLSIYGPLNAYKPAIALALGAVFLGEEPNAAGLAGVAVIVAGSAFLSYAPGNGETHLGRNLLSKGVWFRLLSILLFCIGVIFLKKAVLVSSAFVTLFFWAAFGLLLSVALLAVFRARAVRGNIELTRRRPADFAAVCISMTFVQALTLFSFKIMFVGYAIALFQLASLPDVFLGHRFFGEKNITVRLLGACVMIAGALLIVLCRQAK